MICRLLIFEKEIRDDKTQATRARVQGNVALEVLKGEDQKLAHDGGDRDFRRFSRRCIGAGQGLSGGR